MFGVWWRRPSCSRSASRVASGPRSWSLTPTMVSRRSAPKVKSNQSIFNYYRRLDYARRGALSQRAHDIDQAWSWGFSKQAWLTSFAPARLSVMPCQCAFRLSVDGLLWPQQVLVLCPATARNQDSDVGTSEVDCAVRSTHNCLTHCEHHKAERLLGQVKEAS